MVSSSLFLLAGRTNVEVVMKRQIFQFIGRQI